MRLVRLLSIAILSSVVSCSPAPKADAGGSTGDAAPVGGQASVQDSTSTPDIVRIAVGSKDHTTLVTALKAADLVNSLANAGPFTVFAPTNEAFDKLPKGTVDDLLKPANKDKLTDILQHHVTTSALSVDDFTSGDSITMVDGTKELVKKEGATMWIGSAKVIGSVRGSNGWVHIIDAVLVPAAKK